MSLHPKFTEHFLQWVHQAPDGCWLWAGAHDWDGYGMYRIPRAGVTRRAHRVAFEMAIGPIADGLVIDHLCRVRHCVNPAHMEPVTNVENVRRGESFSARNKRKTHCVNGHEFTPENTVMSGPWRQCRTCRRATGARYQARQKASQ